MILSVPFRQSIADFAELVEQRGLVAKIFIAVLCAVYLMNNIWTARTAYDFVVLPLALCTFPLAELKAVARTPVFLAVAAYLVLLTAAALLVGDPDVRFVAKHALHSLLVLSFIAIAAILAHRDRRFPSICFLAVGIAAALAALVDVAVYYHDQSLNSIWTHRLEGIPGVSMYYNSNVVGDMYAMAFAGAAAVAIRGGLVRWLSALSAAVAAVLFLAVLLSGSRGAILGALMACLVMLILSASWRLRLIVLAIAIGVVLLLLGFTPFFDLLLLRSDNYRLWLWRTYLELAVQRPWLGYGLSTDVSVTLPNGLPVTNAHNIILSAQIRGGLFSAVALVAVITASIREAWRAWKRDNAPLALMLLSTAIGVTSVDYEITAPALGWPWILLWLPVAISLGCGWLSSQAKRGAVPLATVPPTVAIP